MLFISRFVLNYVLIININNLSVLSHFLERIFKLYNNKNEIYNKFKNGFSKLIYINMP